MEDTIEIRKINKENLKDVEETEVEEETALEDGGDFGSSLVW